MQPSTPKLSVFWPIKPLVVSQAFGVLNPSYKQFGFTRHNGIDLPVDDGQPAYAMCDGYVLEVGENKGAGKYVKLETPTVVGVEGTKAVVCFMYMHGKEIKVQRGQYIKAGDVLMLCDNTGFSTGHHLHVSAFLLDAAGKKMRKGNPETDYCFDWSKCWNGFFAQDAQRVFSIYHNLISLLALWLQKK